MFLESGPAKGPALLLAHGAGAPMDSPFMDAIAGALAGHGVRTLRFEFPYMAARRDDGRKRPPDRMPKLEAAFRDAYVAAGGGIFIGGKSMGGRVASMLADDLGAGGVLCLGYPFHPPGKPDRLRTEHLRELQTPGLIVQGERDPFGKREEVGGYGLSPAIRLVWAADGDHNLKPRKASGHSHAGNIAAAAAAAAGFIAEVG